VALDGATTLGAKILVSGGGRCNVTNTVVTERDFWGGSRHLVRRVLKAFTVDETVGFFRELGVALHEEPGGKLFPDSNRARTVLDALLQEAGRRGVRILTGHRVLALTRDDEGFRIDTSQGTLTARRVVLATGGLSLPKTGSDGLGYRFAAALGHSLVPTTPALAPLVLDGDFHAPLSGVSHEVELTMRRGDAKPVTLRGPLLWTHFGVSGPVPMNASRHWLRARLEDEPATVVARLVPGSDPAAIDRRLLTLARESPRQSLRGGLATLLPASVAAAVPSVLGIDPDGGLARLTREQRLRLAKALAEWPLPVRDSRGYSFAEVTAGGVPLDEIDTATMGSRRCPDLHLVGEILDVDGRIGGFNFQWSWSSASVAGKAAVW
jgi:predicted Rossmann fold flavoprotein